MNYNVLYTNNALKNLKKLDKYQAKIITSWIKKHLIGCHNPRQNGKALVGDKKGLWRYRIGVYRIIADIQDNIIQI